MRLVQEAEQKAASIRQEAQALAGQGEAGGLPAGGLAHGQGHESDRSSSPPSRRRISCGSRRTARRRTSSARRTGGRTVWWPSAAAGGPAAGGEVGAASSRPARSEGSAGSCEWGSQPHSPHRPDPSLHPEMTVEQPRRDPGGGDGSSSSRAQRGTCSGRGRATPASSLASLGMTAITFRSACPPSPKHRRTDFQAHFRDEIDRNARPARVFPDRLRVGASYSQ